MCHFNLKLYLTSVFDRIAIKSCCVFPVSGEFSRCVCLQDLRTVTSRSDPETSQFHVPHVRSPGSIFQRIGKTTAKRSWHVCFIYVQTDVELRSRRWKYTHSVVMDGNFSAQHRKMRNPEDDVPLSDGHAFMVHDAKYKEHLKTAKEYQEVYRDLSFRTTFSHDYCVAEIDLQ